jgi:hypothetical protein
MLGWRELEHGDQPIAPDPSGLPPLRLKFIKKVAVVHRVDDAVTVRLE